MIDIAPRAWLPPGVTGQRRRDLCWLISCALCLGIGALTAWLGPVVVPTASNAAGLLERASDLVHPSAALCPFCGGTGAFLACCRGDLGFAAASSLAGVTVFAWMVINLPLRLWAFLRPACRVSTRFVKWTLAIADSTKAQFGMVLAAWAVQIVAHFCGVLVWLPAGG
jgi:hypothetical protein